MLQWTIYCTKVTVDRPGLMHLQMFAHKQITSRMIPSSSREKGNNEESIRSTDQAWIEQVKEASFCLQIGTYYWVWILLKCDVSNTYMDANLQIFEWNWNSARSPIRMGLSAFSIRNNTSAVTKPINQAPTRRNHQYGYHVGQLKRWKLQRNVKTSINRMNEILVSVLKHMLMFFGIKSRVETRKNQLGLWV